MTNFPRFAKSSTYFFIYITMMRLFWRFIGAEPLNIIVLGGGVIYFTWAFGIETVKLTRWAKKKWGHIFTGI